MRMEFVEALGANAFVEGDALVLLVVTAGGEIRFNLSRKQGEKLADRMDYAASILRMREKHEPKG